LKEARRLGHGGRVCGLDPAAAVLEHARRSPHIGGGGGGLAPQPWGGGVDPLVMNRHRFSGFVTGAQLPTTPAPGARVLAPQGRFAFETRNPVARPWEAWQACAPMEVVDLDGARVRMTRELVSPFDGCTVTFTETFSSPGWPQPRVSRSTLRF